MATKQGKQSHSELLQTEQPEQPGLKTNDATFSKGQGVARESIQHPSVEHPDDTPEALDEQSTGSKKLGDNLTKRDPSQSRNSNSLVLDGDGEDAPEPVSFGRSQSPITLHKQRAALHQSYEQADSNKLHQFTLYETSTRFYLVGGDVMGARWRVLKIDRTSPPGQLNIFEDANRYTKKQMRELLNAVDDGNKSSGGLKLKLNIWGIIGFVRFTEAYYMLVITKRKAVAMLGGHYIYEVEATQLVPLTTGSSSAFQRNRNAEETRYLQIFHSLDMTRSFFFSYSYNVTKSLQDNIITERNALNVGGSHPNRDWNEMFIWNHFLLAPAVGILEGVYDWCLPVIHGYMNQSALDVFGHRIYITIIARRSRFFAGARFLKRGANDGGYVANDVESEQIVSDMLTTSFHAPGPRLWASPRYTSYVQHRGSIPLFWTQDNSGVTPKPDITLGVTDPFYQSAALHFDDLFKRYGTPMYVLNLVKSRERTPRESKLLVEYQNALTYLNQFLPQDKKILYRAYDMSRASKTRGQDVIGTLEVIAEEIISKTGIFHDGESGIDNPQVQNGVARTNCIDCLDRTNAAQFVIGKKALGHQLQALGIIASTNVEYDTDCVNMFTHMFHDHGDTIAVQYAGSHLVNTMATYRKEKHWQSDSRNMVESFKRYYHNSFLDSQRQEAYNLFLGNFIFAQGQPMLWELGSDYWLHHADPRHVPNRSRRSYREWFTPQHLETRSLPDRSAIDQTGLLHHNIGKFDNYWLEYYKPLTLSSLRTGLMHRMDISYSFLPDKGNAFTYVDLSPFTPRRPITAHDRQRVQDHKIVPTKKGVTIVDPNSDPDALSQNMHRSKQSSLFDELSSKSNSGILREPKLSIKTSDRPTDRTMMHTWSLNDHYFNALNPTIEQSELDEYARYVAHPLHIPLVVSNELPDDLNADYIHYVDFDQYAQMHAPLGLPSHEKQDLRGISESLDFSGRMFVQASEETLAIYQDFCEVRENPLTVTEEDLTKKRYKAYRQWLKGKSFFKQSKVDPEYREPNAV